jgi:hypothetical protein
MLILALWAHAGAEESSALLHLTIDECEGQVIADKSGYLSQADFLHPVPDRNTAKGTACTFRCFVAVICHFVHCV